MANFNLADYETVEERITKFYEKYPDGRIITMPVPREPADLTTIIFTCLLYKDAEQQKANLPLAMGWAFEREGKGMVNQTSHLENAETSAIGRALANADFAKKGSRASREEMEKVQRGTASKAPQAAPKPVDSGKEAEQRAQIRAWLLEMEGGDIDAAKSRLFELTTFTAKDGKVVAGVQSVDQLKGRRLEVIYGKTKDLHSAWRHKPLDEPEDVDDLFYGDAPGGG